MLNVPTNPPPASPPPSEKPPRRRFVPTSVRKRIEFEGVDPTKTDDYHSSTVKSLYDGPKGAMLHLFSIMSLHEPLIGRMLRKRKFDLAGFRTILDLGSGAGQILKSLSTVADPEATIVGLDLSHRMLMRARKRVAEDRVKYMAGNMLAMPFADESFDCITCGWVIEYLPDVLPGLREMSRVLKPGGSLLLLASEDDFFGSWVSRSWKCRTYNRGQLRTDCESVGLPWARELYFTRLHQAFGRGGIVFEARKATTETKP